MKLVRDRECRIEYFKYENVFLFRKKKKKKKYACFVYVYRYTFKEKKDFVNLCLIV